MKGRRKRDLNEIVDADEIAVLAVAELPRLSVSEDARLGDASRLGEVDHPHSHIHFVVHDEKRTADDLQTRGAVKGRGRTRL